MEEARKAGKRNDTAALYWPLKLACTRVERRRKRRPGQFAFDADQAKAHFNPVTEGRGLFDAASLSRATERSDPEMDQALDVDITEDEIDEAIRHMKNSASGKDAVCIENLLYGGPSLRKHPHRIVKARWDGEVSNWPEEVKVGIQIPASNAGQRTSTQNLRQRRV